MYVIFPAEELINLSLGLSPEGQELIPFKRGGSMASSLRDLSHPALNDALKAHNELTFKLVRTVSEFTGQLGQCHEGHAEQLQRLVENFRKKNAELRKERPACTSSVFAAWEALLAEVEVDSQAHADVASTLGRQVSRPLIERSFFRKIQSRKVFTHRESLDTILSKTEDMLAKCRQEYKAAYLACISSPGGGALGAYLDAHNAYVQQLRATNAMLDTYNQDTLPQLLQELEEVYTDLCATLADSVLQGAEIISTKAGDQGRRYAGLCSVCRAVSGSQDVALLARALATPACSSPQRLHNFNPPKPPQQPTPEDGSEPPPPPPPANLPPALRDELNTDRASSIHPVRPRLEALRREASDLEAQTRNLSDSLETLLRMQQRSIEANLYNKANELQEDISLKRFDLRVAQIHLAAVRAQKELFSAKAEGPGTDQSAAAAKESRERKMSSSSSGSMKSKWLSAFKSLKSGGQSSNQQQQDNVPPSTAAATSPGTAVGVSNIASVQAATAASVSAGSKKNQMYHAVSVIMSMRKKQTESAAVGPVESGAHLFQEYTYKKITPCDVCSQVLRGHSRQGVKCRLCKMNAHADCAEKAPRCQTKSRLLRRQKSTSEIETRPAVTETAAPIDEERSEDELEPLNEQPEQPQEQPKQQRPRRTHRNHVSEVDATYEVLRQAGELGGGSRRSTPPAAAAQESGGSSAGSSATSLRGRPTTSRAACPPPSINPSNSAAVAAMAAMSELHDSAETSTRQRRRLFAGMKSFSVLHHSSAVHHGGATGHAHSRSISLPETPGLPAAAASCNNNSGATISYSSTIVCPECWPPSVPRQRAPTTAPHSPRRHKLNLRMKSLSLDSPESSEHAAAAQRRARGLQPSSATAIGGGGSSGGSNSSHLQSPSSPVHNRRLLSARNMRMSSVELPDDNEKSLSSASTSPCPSPKPHRLLPTNLYVVLYNFKSRHPDELDLRAGYKLTVIDSSDADWWRGKCLGRVGYFPSKYVLRLQPGERPLQVTHNLQLADQENGLTLLRDQIVVQVGEELDGMVMIRSGDNRQAACPLSFLQEV